MESKRGKGSPASDGKNIGEAGFVPCALILPVFQVNGERIWGAADIITSQIMEVWEDIKPQAS